MFLLQIMTKLIISLLLKVGQVVLHLKKLIRHCEDNFLWNIKFGGKVSLIFGSTPF